MRSLALLLLAPALVFSARCTEVAFKPELAGTSYDIVQPESFKESPSKRFTTRISGKVVIVDRCTIKLDPLTLSNAPADARIKLYARRQSDPSYSFPINTQILNGTYANAAGPSFVLTNDFVNANILGLSFLDFDQIVVFAEADNWLIATADLPRIDFNANPAPKTPTSPSAPSVQPTNAPGGSNNFGVAFKVSLLSVACGILFALF